jgi:hypothetical protein
MLNLRCQQQETAFGVLDPPLGSARLKAVEMVAALARLGSPDAEGSLVTAELLPRCMALFVQYPFNNLLHHQVSMDLGMVLLKPRAEASCCQQHAVRKVLR